MTQKRSDLQLGLSLTTLTLELLDSLKNNIFIFSFSYKNCAITDGYYKIYYYPLIKSYSWKIYCQFIFVFILKTCFTNTRGCYAHKQLFYIPLIYSYMCNCHCLLIKATSKYTFLITERILAHEFSNRLNLIACNIHQSGWQYNNT